MTASHAMYGVGHCDCTISIMYSSSHYPTIPLSLAHECNCRGSAYEPHPSLCEAALPWQHHTSPAPPSSRLQGNQSRGRGNIILYLCIIVIKFVKIINSSQFYELLTVLWARDLMRLTLFLFLFQRKAHAVVEQLLKSEAAFLSSLNIAIEVNHIH